mmetsp:Transcript_15768/g.21668  ORF Transcript_15768/g.21668 Transcript_15768/m.21668 type:complete len:337 (+) Transcript_15768:84-1094(+)
MLLTFIKFIFFLCLSSRLCSIECNRSCIQNDTYCGDWKGRIFIPYGECPYRQITSEQARQCVGNRTLLFTGDSQMRDLGHAVGLFLQGQPSQENLDDKFNKHTRSIWNVCTKIGYFPSWGQKNRGNVNGYLFPKRELLEVYPMWNWQVQVWEIFSNKMVESGTLQNVLSNEMMKENNETMQLRKIDLAFWNHGLHDLLVWNSPPFGKRYYDTVVSTWLTMRTKVPTPTIWVSLNNNCLELLKLTNKLMIPAMTLQAVMVEEANWYIHKRLREEKLPYWDAATVLRSPQRCNVSGDGLHVKLFVDNARANILFNKLCDENFQWIGGVETFIEPYTSL